MRWVRLVFLDSLFFLGGIFRVIRKTRELSQTLCEFFAGKLLLFFFSLEFGLEGFNSSFMPCCCSRRFADLSQP